MEHFILYCIIMSLATLISIAIARPEKKHPLPNNNLSPSSSQSQPPVSNTFTSWRRVVSRYEASQEQATQNTYPRQLKLFGGKAEVIAS